MEDRFENNTSLSIEDKIKDLEDVFRGWKQYYKSDSYSINNFYEYLIYINEADKNLSKGRILKTDNDKDFDVYINMTQDFASKIADFASNYGLVSYIEDSGCRGRHVWVLFDQWISSDKAYVLAKFLSSPCTANDDISIEIFPNGVRTKQFGQIVKLPLGIHKRTGRRSCFLTKDGFIYDDEKSLIDSMVKNDVNIVDKIVTTQCNVLSRQVSMPVIPNLNRDISEITSDNNLIWSVLNGCSIIRYLCFKAKDTAYLTHGERLTLLYVFGHMDEEGGSFLHSIIGLTLNYNYAVTEKFINKIPAKPISCVKIRDQYKDLTAGLGCNCSFKLVKNSYPSPVLHALKEKDDNKITLPVSLVEDLTVEDKKTFEDKLNVPKQTEEFVNNLIELKKKKRALEKEIGLCENQLNQIFDSLKIDSLEASIGTLVRQRKDNKIYWNLEL
ncbi:MAG: hypothetical protein FWC47_12035 [Oscillospiraceae bacterium]|nr:hypothetical protein [Oscillospiraceae bacterium]